MLTLASLVAGMLFAFVGIRLLAGIDRAGGVIYLIAGAGSLVYAWIGYRTSKKGW